MTIRYRKAAPAEPIWFDRKKVEDAIDKLIALLDYTDPDPEAEDNGDAEAFLATTPQEDKSSGTEWLHANGNRIDTSDRELEDEHDEDSHDREEDKADSEPWLGWTVDGEYPLSPWGDDDLELEFEEEDDWRDRT